MTNEFEKGAIWGGWREVEERAKSEYSDEEIVSAIVRVSKALSKVKYAGLISSWEYLGIGIFGAKSYETSYYLSVTQAEGEIGAHIRVSADKGKDKIFVTLRGLFKDIQRV